MLRIKRYKHFSGDLPPTMRDPRAPIGPRGPNDPLMATSYRMELNTCHNTNAEKTYKNICIEGQKDRERTHLTAKWVGTFSDWQRPLKSCQGPSVPKQGPHRPTKVHFKQKEGLCLPERTLCQPQRALFQRTKGHRRPEKGPLRPKEGPYKQAQDHLRPTKGLPNQQKGLSGQWNTFFDRKISLESWQHTVFVPQIVLSKLGLLLHTLGLHFLSWGCTDNP